MRDICEFVSLINARYFKSHIYKITKQQKNFSEFKNIKSRLEVRPVHAKRSDSRRKRIGILPRNLATDCLARQGHGHGPRAR